MDNKFQLQSGNDYTPSPRAAKAMSSSTALKDTPVVCDGPSSSGTQDFRKGSGDNPGSNVGGQPPKESQQGGEVPLDNARSVNDRKA